MKRVYLFFAVLCVFASLRCDVAFASQAPYPAPAVPYAELETGDSIVVKMAGAKTTTEPTCYIAWVDTQETNYAPNNTKVSFNDTTEVTALAAPATGFHRLACSITVCNIDTVSQSISVAVANGANRYYLLNAYALAANATVSLTIGGTVSATPLALPVTVPNGGTGDTSLTAHGVLLGEGTSNVTVTAAGGSAQLLLGQGAADPTWNTMSGDCTLTSAGVISIGASKVTNADLAGSIAASKLIGTDIATVGTITSGTWNGTTIAVANGGTGLTSGTSGGIPAYTATGTITSSALLTQYGVLCGGGAGAVPTATTAGTSGQPLVSNGGGAGGNPSFQALNLATAAAITGNLPLGNGGTNAALTASNGGIVYSNASAFAVLGGTATANKILYSGASSAPAWSTPTFPVTASAASLRWIRSDGTNWIASSTTLYDTPTTGDLVYASSATALTGLADVAVGSLLRSQGVGVAPAYSAVTYTDAPTSGGIPYYSSTTALSSSALLSANQVVIGGGAGTAPSTLAAGTQGKALIMGASNPAYSYVVQGTSAKSANYTIAQGDCGFIVQSSGANTVITLPKASTVGTGFYVWVEDNDSTNTQTIKSDATTPDTIESNNVSSNGIVLTQKKAKMGFASLGSGNDWVLIESHGDYQSATGSSTIGNTYANLTSLTLTQGEWDVSVSCDLSNASTGSCGLNLTSSSAVAGAEGDNELDSFETLAGDRVSIGAVNYRFWTGMGAGTTSIAAWSSGNNYTVYANAFGPAATTTVKWKIIARRIR